MHRTRQATGQASRRLNSILRSQILTFSHENRHNVCNRLCHDINDILNRNDVIVLFGVLC